MTKVALLVELKAKLGKERELATFLTAQSIFKLSANV
jgi:hypothetical protein